MLGVLLVYVDVCLICLNLFCGFVGCVVVKCLEYLFCCLFIRCVDDILGVTELFDGLYLGLFGYLGWLVCLLTYLWLLCVTLL